MTLQIKGDGGIYKATWSDSGVEMIFDRFRERDGAVRAELWVRDNTFPNPHLAFDTMNLGSKRTRNMFAKELEAQYPGQPWNQMLEAACVRVLLEHRKGEPVQNIQDIVLYKAQTWRVEPYVFQGYPTLMYGSGGIGKSLFAAYMATLTVEGWVTEDIRINQCPVLYLDWESTEEDLAERADMVSAGLELIDRPQIYYRYCSRPLAEDFDYIKRQIIEKDIGFVVVDSAGPAAGSPIEPDSVIRFFTALRAMKVSALILGHKPHGGTNPFGCYSDDTEVLTDSGWKYHSEVTKDDMVAAFDPKEECIKWEMPVKIHEYDYEGEMIHITGDTKGTLNALVTPNHRMVVKPAYKLPTGERGPNRNPREWHFKEAQDLNATPYKIPYANKGFEGRHNVSLNYSRFIGWWVSEGSLNDDAPVLTQGDGSVLERMKETITAMGYEYNINQINRPTEQPCFMIRMRGATDFGRELAGLCGRGAYNKRLPKPFMTWSYDSRMEMLKALIEGDGTIRPSGRMEYTTISPQLADDIQILAISLGYGARIVKRSRRNVIWHDQYAIYIDPRRTLSLRKHNRRTVDYKGKVYCLTVPSGAYITRRKGYMTIAGNSVYWINYSRSVWEMNADKSPGNDYSDIGLINTKVNRGALHANMAYRVSFSHTDTGNSVFYGVLNPGDLEVVTERLPLKDRVTDLLKRSGSMHYKDIASYLEVTEGSIKGTLAKNRNRFQSLGQGMYGISTSIF